MLEENDGDDLAFPITRSSDYQITRSFPFSVSPCLRGRFAFPIPAMTRDVVDPGDPPSPRHSPHPIPLIPIWRGFELFFFIPSNARDPYNLEECLRKTTVTICFPIPGDDARCRRSRRSLSPAIHRT